MPNVKPGDLCIVVSAKNTPDIIGRVVTVVKSAIPGDVAKSVCNFSARFEPTSQSVTAWWVSSGDYLPWVTKDKLSRMYEMVPVADAHLVKIKDGDLTFDETSEVDKDINLTKEKEAV